MACQRDKNTDCCYWLHMPPSETGRTAAETEALESKGIMRLVKRSDAVTALTWYIRKYRKALHDAKIEVKDIPDDDWLRENPPNGPGINLGPNFPSNQAGGPGSTQQGKGKTKRRTRRKKGTRRRKKGTRRRKKGTRRRKKRKSKRKY